MPVLRAQPPVEGNHHPDDLRDDASRRWALGPLPASSLPPHSVLPSVEERVRQQWDAQGAGIVAMAGATPIDMAMLRSTQSNAIEEERRELLSNMAQDLQLIPDERIKLFKDWHYLIELKRAYVSPVGTEKLSDEVSVARTSFSTDNTAVNSAYCTIDDKAARQHVSEQRGQRHTQPSAFAQVGKTTTAPHPPIPFQPHRRRIRKAPQAPHAAAAVRPGQIKAMTVQNPYIRSTKRTKTSGASGGNKNGKPRASNSIPINAHQRMSCHVPPRSSASVASGTGISAVARTQAAAVQRHTNSQTRTQAVEKFHRLMCQRCCFCLGENCDGRSCLRGGFRCYTCGSSEKGHNFKSCTFNYRWKCSICCEIVYRKPNEHKRGRCKGADLKILGEGYKTISKFLHGKGVCTMCFDWHGKCTGPIHKHGMKKRMWELLVRESNLRNQDLAATVMRVFDSPQSRDTFIAQLPEFERLRTHYPPRTL